jgi:hypothetical protein
MLVRHYGKQELMVGHSVGGGGRGYRGQRGHAGYHFAELVKF